MLNIGFRPTIDSASAVKTIEAHLFDADGDFYGEQIVIHFVKRLRDEMKFSGIDALKDQLERDKAASLRYYEKGNTTYDPSAAMVLAINLNAQEPLPASLNINEYGIYRDHWTRIEQRWLQSQPVVLAFTGQETYLGGQLLHLNNMEMVLYPQRDAGGT